MGNRVRIARTAGLGVLLLAGCRALLDLPPVGESETLTTDSGPINTAVDGMVTGVQDAGLDVQTILDCDPLEAEEGDYIYQLTAADTPGMEGLFTVDPADSTKDMPTANMARTPEAGTSTFGTELRRVDGGGYSMKFRYNPTHFDKFVFERSRTSALTVISVTDSLFSVDVKASCKDPVPLVQCAMTPGLSWNGFASGFFGDAPFTATLKFDYIDEGADSFVNVGGVRVDTWHVKEHRTFEGQVSGQQDNHYWFARRNGMLVKGMLAAGTYSSNNKDGVVVVAGPFTFEFKGHVEFVLTSMTPNDGG